MQACTWVKAGQLLDVHEGKYALAGRPREENAGLKTWRFIERVLLWLTSEVAKEGKIVRDNDNIRLNGRRIDAVFR